MVKTKACKSKKVTSAQRHKVDRKKREAKRDMRKAAKSLRKAGKGPKRNKKSREAAKLALKVSNADPDKEMILTNLLLAREQARVVRSDKRLQKKEKISELKAKKEELGSDYDENDENEETISQEKMRKGHDATAASDRSVLYIPTNKSWNMMYQFYKTVDDLVFPIDEDSPAGEGTQCGLPCTAFLVTADARCSVQSIPWTLLDRIAERAEEYEAANAGTPHSHFNSVLIVIALTKVDCLSAKAIGTQISLLDNALYSRYYKKYDENEDSASKTVKNTKKKDTEKNTTPVKRRIPHITFTVCPVSIYFDNSVKHLLKILNYHNIKTFGSINDKDIINKTTNLLNKTACFLIGLPNTGRRSLSRALQTIGTESIVSMIPLRAAKIVQVLKNGKAVSDDTDDDDNTMIKFALPGAKQLTIVTFPEDESLKNITSSNVVAGDILFQSPSFIERIQEPEACAMLIVNSVIDKVTLAQAFCQPAICTGDTTDDMKGCEIFLKGIGHTVRREKGFNVSPMLVNSACTAGQISSSSLLASSGFTSQKTTLLSSTFSNARCGKFVRIGSVMTKGKKGSTGGFGVKRADGHNALRIGARTFIREFCQSKNVPWAVLRPGPSDDPISAADASYIRALSIDAFNASLKKEQEQDGKVPSFATFAEALSIILKPNLVLLPSAVIEMGPSAIAPILHDVDGEFTDVQNGDNDVDSDDEMIASDDD